ncbi:hypothetical protein CCACVL1_24323 [Corchorus capsularis]|uniref:Uncharacterized protein n=1 Tax=Corchorus capsularis TaxID=210143 RepID=A0A1R3GQ88_COCAP|nr:hypothetical protein CCACVL1_24323 [Corchorus capsularis]
MDEAPSLSLKDFHGVAADESDDTLMGSRADRDLDFCGFPNKKT